MPKSYLIHDNGGRPFKVTVLTKNSVIISKHVSKDDDPQYEEWKTINGIQKIFIGKDNEPNFTGNSILLKMSSNSYIFIGQYIYSFKTDDEIKKFYSPVGNSDIPYPFAVGTKNTYLLIESDYVENDVREEQQLSDDPYYQYYGHTGEKYPNHRIKGIKLLHTRLWGPTILNGKRYDDMAKVVTNCSNRNVVKKSTKKRVNRKRSSKQFILNLLKKSKPRRKVVK